jgi:predicted AlkP superfamily phosphohydrolase/phosphomutase
MDPVFVENHWSQLPNLDRLRRQGGFQRLATTNPPQSPVAWSAVITGLDPSGHGIYDFLHRDPQSITPYSSMAEAEEGHLTLAFGQWLLPLQAGSIRSLRHGQAFWEFLGARGIPAALLRMPTNFPPIEFPGESLAGMGTPDLQGGFGAFTYFTAEPAATTRLVSGGRIVKLATGGSRAVLSIAGPSNPFLKAHPPSTASLVVDSDPAAGTARITSAAGQFVLHAGEWSPWIRLDFPLLGPIKGATGNIRMLLQSVAPHLAVYVSAVNIDPFQPALPISTPASYSRTLAEALGPYSTQGIAEDTAALRAGVLTHNEFLQQAGHVLDESMAMFRHELARYRDGLLFFYFSSVDQHSHVLWGSDDRRLAEIYARVDQAVGLAMQRLGTDGTLIVMSDHGFSTFSRAIHLNAWLMREGFLTLADPSSTGDEELFAHVDWSQTQAYALGLNEIYLNLAGREPNGIVSQGEESRAVMAKIRGRLLALRDPQSGRAAVREVYSSSQISAGAPPAHAPDLVVGYEPGFRASWQTALGAVPATVIADNREAWLADHCIDPQFVPGVFVSNRAPRLAAPHLRDIPVTILQFFGLTPPHVMTGKDIF